MDIHGIVAEVDQLATVDGHDQALFPDLLYRFRLRQVDFDARLQDGRRDHKDDQEHQHDVHKGNDIDLGKGGPGLACKLRHAIYPALRLNLMVLMG